MKTQSQRRFAGL